MFAIFGVSLLKGKLGYCGVGPGRSYYEISQSQVFV